MKSFTNRLPVLLFLTLVGSACDGDVGLAGLWTGTSRAGIALSITLTETPDGVLSGSGRIVVGISQLPINAVGAHAHPSVSLTIDAVRINFAPVSFQGALHGDMRVIQGVLNNGVGFLNDSLTLIRSTPPAPRITAP